MKQLTGSEECVRTFHRSPAMDTNGDRHGAVEAGAVRIG